MRFLIFNIVVFLSIGYLFTAAPGQSVGNWLDATIDMVSQSVASAPPNAASRQILASEDKMAPSAVSASAPVTSQNDDIKITADKIQEIVSASINSNLREIAASLGGVQADNTAPLPHAAATTAAPADQTAPLSLDRVSQTAATGKTQGLLNPHKTLPTVSQLPADADTMLASGFSELYPADSTAVSATRDAPASQDMVAAPVFMSPGDRQAALSELIQNLQLTYLERAVE